MKLTKNALAATLVVFIGLIQVLGFLTRLDSVRALGKATVASPLPLVFTSVGIFESFATELTIELVFQSGGRLTVPVTSETYSRLHGPYDRRGAYAMLLVHAPLWPQHILNSIVGFGFCRDGPLARAFELQEDIAYLLINISSKADPDEGIWTRVVQCKD